MDIERAINGVITSFEDVMSVRGQGDMARRLRPYLQDSFKEQGSFLHRLFDASPGYADQWVWYGHCPAGLRRKVVSQYITRKEWQDVLPLGIQGFMFLADLYRSKGITAAEAERLITQGFQDALTGITLDELVRVHDNVSENDIRDALSRLKLSTGSVAGADKRLHDELDQSSAASHNWWKFDLAISYTLLSSKSTLLGNQCFF